MLVAISYQSDCSKGMPCLHGCNLRLPPAFSLDLTLVLIMAEGIQAEQKLLVPSLHYFFNDPMLPAAQGSRLDDAH